jgi:hypothetical protein
MLSHIRSLAGSTIDTLESSFRKRQHKITNRLEAGQRLIIQFSQVRLNDKRICHHEQGVAIRCSARHSFGSDQRGRAGAVLDHHRRAGTADFFRSTPTATATLRRNELACCAIPDLRC